MSRKLTASVTTVIATLLVSVLGGCSFQASAGTGSPTTPQQPAPPPAQQEPAPPPVAVTPEPTPAPPATQSEVKQEGAKLKMPGEIKFEFGKATLLPESEPVLEQLRAFLDLKKAITLVRIEGHTDNVGQAAANLKLSGERALTVRQWLINHNIDEKRLVAVGFGDLKPVADNSTDAGRAQNRRTEFIVVEVGNKPWLGADPLGGGTVFGTNPR